MKKKKSPTNKLNKTNIILILLALVLLGLIIYIGWIKLFKKGGEISLAELNALQSQNQDQITYKDVKSTIKKDEKKEIQEQWQQYTNNKYGYSLRYPNDWYIEDENANAPIENTDFEDNSIKTGGELILSNYNLDQLNPDDPQSLPDDFRIMRLLIYQDDKGTMTINDLAQAKSYIDKLKAEKIGFKAENMIGYEYISATYRDGSVDANIPRIEIFFQENNRFYVFNFGYIPIEDDQTRKTMERIASTFVLN
ncbi:MAG: hypothetical protein GF332_04235 [Candidatus Moranbacteria bacterium]|nr:hypothetical protein [Candidatus Moranbacteria bacterium]